MRARERALTFAEYRASLAAAGFTDIQLTPTHSVADGMHSAIIRATKPTAAPEPVGTASGTASACRGVNACCTPDENAVDPTTTVAQTKSAAGCGCQS